jgi:hypothetical protein
MASTSEKETIMRHTAISGKTNRHKSTQKDHVKSQLPGAVKASHAKQLVTAPAAPKRRGK